MEKSKYCTYCGQKLDAEARFCILCGKLQEDFTMEKQKPPVSDIEGQQAEPDVVQEIPRLSAEKLGSKARDTAKVAFTDFSQKMKDANLSDRAKKTAQSAFDEIKQSSKDRKRTRKSEKEKKKASLFETEILDGEEAAKELYERNTKKLERCKLGLIVAVIASVVGGIGLAMQFELISLPLLIENVIETLLPFAIIGSAISYILAGGILTAIRYSFRIAEFGWFLIPIFPIDLCIGFLALAFSIMTFIYVPIVSVGINYVQTKKNIEQAELYFGIVRN